MKPLGKGGVGEIYEVEHAHLGRRAALKILHGELIGRHGLAARIADEGRWLAAVRHDNLVDVLDLGVLDTDGRPYLVLELLDGRDLRGELTRLGVLSIPAALEIVAQALRGIGALHNAGLVHRDVKLENLFLCADGRVKVLDLGAAEPLALDKPDSLRGPSLGTPRTMAPEQNAGKPVDERADLYAMGLVLYELVAGRGPFDDVETLEALRFAHCERVPAPPSRFAPQAIPAELDEFVLRALAKSPDDRFPSAEAMLLALRAIMPQKSVPNFSKSSAELLLQPTEPFATFSSRTHSPRPGIAHVHPTIQSRRTARGVHIASDRALPAVVSALAVASLALGLVVGRLLPPSIPAQTGAPVAAVR